MNERRTTEDRAHGAAAHVRLLGRAAVIANQPLPAAEALQQVLDELAWHTGWPVAHVYLPSPALPGALAPAPIWHLEQPGRFELFRGITEATVFVPGVGLVGEVQSTGRPVWSADVQAEPRFVRRHAEQDLGVRAGVLFPVMAGADVVGVLECFSPEPAAQDAALLEVLFNVGVMLGRIVERAEAEARASGLLLRVQALAAALEQAPLAAAEQLATAVAHELNNPLYAARGALGLLEDELARAGAVSPFLGIAREELARMSAVLHRMLMAREAATGLPPGAPDEDMIQRVLGSLRR